jgi:hypothetical protein
LVLIVQTERRLRASEPKLLPSVLDPVPFIKAICF